MSTFTNSLERFIIEQIDAMRVYGEHKQFVLSYEFRAEYWDDNGMNKIQVAPRFVKLLVDARQNYVGVWILETTVYVSIFDMKDIAPDKWHFLSYHDTCWRSEGMIWMFENWIRMRNEIMPKLQQIGISNMDTINNCISVTPDLHSFRPVTFERKSSDDYRCYTIDNLKLISQN